ncbi:MAG: BatD family protein [Candidatus Binatia bacterium]
MSSRVAPLRVLASWPRWVADAGGLRARPRPDTPRRPARLLAYGVLAVLGIFITSGSQAVAPTPSAVPPVTARARADRKQITIGDPFRYTVQVSAAADTEVIVPVLSGTLGDFTISDFGELPTRKEKGRIIMTRWYTLTTFTTGDLLIPAPTVQYRTAGTDLHEAQGNDVLIGVTSVLAQARNANDIRDVKPPEEVPFDWRPYGTAAGALILAGLLGMGFFYLLNRPRRQRVLPSRPAHEVALAALNRLRARHLIDAGQFEAYYVELSTIVRRYLEERFRVRAPEMTTEEFLTAVAHDGRLLAAHRRLLAEFLVQADLVKFARHQPAKQDSEAAYAAARRFVEETRPSAASQPDAEAQHAAA